MGAPIQRCPWPGIDDPEYARYHDEEWGVPKTHDRDLFEKLVLESFQSGLSWLTILRKRDNFRAAFDGFDAKRLARYGARDIERLMNDAGIVRNRLKIEAAIANAQAYLRLAKRQSLSDFLWSFLEDGPVRNRWHDLKDVPAQTELSRRVASGLKGEGFRFLGPTTVYAFMQASGMVNDHLVSCPRHDVCAGLQKKSKPRAAGRMN